MLHIPPQGGYRNILKSCSRTNRVDLYSKVCVGGGGGGGMDNSIINTLWLSTSKWMANKHFRSTTETKHNSSIPRRLAQSGEHLAWCSVGCEFESRPVGFSSAFSHPGVITCVRPLVRSGEVVSSVHTMRQPCWDSRGTQRHDTVFETLSLRTEQNEMRLYIKSLDQE